MAVDLAIGKGIASGITLEKTGIIEQGGSR